MPLDRASTFGRCCTAMRDALEASPSNFRIDKEVLYLVVGGKQQPGFVDQVVFYCPFCGTKLQTPDAVRAKILRD